MSIQFSDYTFVPYDSGESGTVLVPAAAFDGKPAASIPVVDLAGRSVVYEGCGPTFYVDSAAGTKEFVGWSYWESESTEDLDAPCVQLMVLSDDFKEEDYRG